MKQKKEGWPSPDDGLGHPFFMAALSFFRLYTLPEGMVLDIGLISCQEPRSSKSRRRRSFLEHFTYGTNDFFVDIGLLLPHRPIIIVSSRNINWNSKYPNRFSIYLFVRNWTEYM